MKDNKEISPILVSLLIFIVSILTIILIFKGFSYLCLNGNKKSNKKDNSTTAYVCAIDVVEKHLKSPSTAKFCGATLATITDLGDNKYKVKGYVDAKNSFGAEVREYFIVTLTLSGNGYKDAYCSIY